MQKMAPGVQCAARCHSHGHTHTHSLTDTAACVQSHTPTCRVLLLLLPDKSLSIDPCLCTSEAAAGGKERERQTRVVNFCLNSDDGKSSVNTPTAPPPTSSPSGRAGLAAPPRIPISGFAALDCLSFSFSPLTSRRLLFRLSSGTLLPERCAKR